MPEKQARPMGCPKCGGIMNHHAEKLILTSRPGGQGMDEALGGYVDEMHACPNCGNIESRPA